MQVLLSLVKCPGGKLLTDMNLIDIFQACFKIGHFTGNAQKEITGRSPLEVQILLLTCERSQHGGSEDIEKERFGPCIICLGISQ